MARFGLALLLALAAAKPQAPQAKSVRFCLDLMHCGLPKPTKGRFRPRVAGLGISV